MTDASKPPLETLEDRTTQICRSDNIRFAALGDSATFGMGDPVERGWRGWARLLADAIATAHQVTFCNLAVPGATLQDVRDVQLPRALEHRASLVSLVVGLNDVMRSTWNPVRFREDLLDCAQKLAASGALILTARFHDHGRVFGLPRWVSGRMAARIDVLNGIYDEVHERYGALRIDLGDDPATYDRGFWAADRLHPSEHGHRHLASRAATLLNELGLDFQPPSPACTSPRSTARRDAFVLITKAVPWIALRLLDLTPAAIGLAVTPVGSSRDDIRQAPEAARGTSRSSWSTP